MTNEIVVTSMHISVQRVHTPANCMALNVCDGSGPWHSLHNTIKVSNTLGMQMPLLHAKQ